VAIFHHGRYDRRATWFGCSRVGDFVCEREKVLRG
jgi:hypothetical protein